MKQSQILVIIAFLTVLAAISNASHQHDWNTDTLTNGFWGLNDQLADSGIEVGFCMTTVYQRNVSGGLSTSRRTGEFTGSYDLEVSADLQKLLGIEGILFLHGEGGWDEGIDAVSVAPGGTFFGVNADAIGARAFDLVEFYYQVGLTDDLELTIGKFDTTAFFDTSWYANDEATQFINGALVNNPGGPFGDYKLGVLLRYDITDDWYLMGSVTDAEGERSKCGFSTTFDGDKHFFYIAETGVNTVMNSENGSLPGIYRFGIFYDPQPKAYEGGPEQTDDLGFYLGGDQLLIKENATKGDAQGLGGFFRYGWASEDKNDINQVFSFGVQYQGLIDGRDDDVLGIGYANGIFSDKAKDTYPEDHESVFETYYSIAVTKWMALSPSVQYISNPGGTNTSDATVVSLRAHITF